VRERERERGFLALFLILILGLVLFGYFPSFRADFQFDDLESIVNNSYIKITSLDFRSLARAGKFELCIKFLFWRA